MRATFEFTAKEMMNIVRTHLISKGKLDEDINRGGLSMNRSGNIVIEFFHEDASVPDVKSESPSYQVGDWQKESPPKFSE